MKSDFLIALTQLAAERNLPREIVLSAIEAALVSAYKRDSVAAGQDISVELDPNSGEVSVFIVKTVVEKVDDPHLEISLDEARKIKANAQIGDIVPIKSLPHHAGRIAAQTAKQVVIQRLREAERELVFQEYSDKEGEVYTVTVQRVEPKQVIVELGRGEAVLPLSEQSPYDRYRVGQRFKVLLQSVRQSNKGPELVVSRADRLLVKRLFEMEVPEIYNGAVEIVAIAREAGSRSKVAVFAKQDGVDAVGSCVGLRGIRIQNIVNELHGEKIDVVQWNKDLARFIASALSPSIVLRVDVNREAGSALAVVPERQLSLAIGKEGQNARLAAKLTGLKVDIKSDVELQAIEEELAEAAAIAAKAAAVEKVMEVPAPDVVEEVVEKVVGPVKVPEELPIAAESIPAVPEAPEIVEEPEVPKAPDVVKITEAPKVVELPQPPSPTKEIAAEQEFVIPAAELTPTDERPVPEQEVDDTLEPAVVEEEPLPFFTPEQEPEPVAVPSTTQASLHDLPEDIWNIRPFGGGESGIIRFAEDIDELNRGPRGGGKRSRRSGGSQRGSGQGGRRKTKSGRRR